MLLKVGTNRPSALRRIVRVSVTGGLFSGLSFVGGLPSENFGTTLVEGAAPVILILSAIAVFNSTTHRGLSGWVTGACMHDERVEAQ